MKKKKLNFILALVVYPFDIMFSFNQTDAELGKVLNRYGELPIDEIELCRLAENGRGRFVHFSMGASLIRLKDYPETPQHYGHLQHEIFHAVMVIFEKVGMEYTFRKSDEAYAYLIQYITEQVYENIHK